MRLEQDPIHRHKDVLAHTIAVVAKTSPRLVVRLSALLHDVGKPKTRSIGPKGVSFHHHEVVGARMARDRLRALRYSNEIVDDVQRLVFLHLRFHGYRDDVWSDSAVRRYARDAGPLLEDLNELTRCDCTTRNERKARMLATRMDALEGRIAELREREELGAIRPDIDGNRVMELLGVGPGRVIGEALDDAAGGAARRGPARGGRGRASRPRLVGRAPVATDARGVARSTTPHHGPGDLTDVAADERARRGPAVSLPPRGMTAGPGVSPTALGCGR